MTKRLKAKTLIIAAHISLSLVLAVTVDARAATEYLVPAGEALGPSVTSPTLVNLRLGRVESLAFSHDRQSLASVAQDGTICIWDLGTGRPTRCQRIVGTARATAIAWSPRDLWLAIGDSDGRVELLARSGAGLSPGCTLPALSNKPNLGRAISSLTFVEQDGTLLSMGSRNESLRSCPRAFEPGRTEGASVQVSPVSLPALRGLPGLVDQAALSRDGAMVAVASGNSVGVWETQSGQARWSKGDLPSLPVSLALSPDGQSVVVGMLNGAISRFRVGTGIEQPLREKPEGQRTMAARALSYSEEGRVLFASSDDRSLTRYELATDRLRSAAFPLLAEQSAMAVSHDGMLLAVAQEGKILLLDATSGTTLRTLHGNAVAVLTMAWNPGGTFLATASEDRQLRIWRRIESAAPSEPAWELFCRLDRSPAPQVQALAFAPPDGLTLAVAQAGGGTELLDVRACPVRTAQVLPGNDEWQRALAFSHDGSRLAIGTDDGSIRVWDLASRRLRATLLGHRDEVRALAFIPGDSSLLASGSLDKTVRLWQVASGKELAASPEQSEGVRALAFASDGRRLLSAAGKEVALWRVEAERLLTPQPYGPSGNKIGHSSPVLGVAFVGPDRIATTQSDGHLRLLDLATQQQLQEFPLAASPGRQGLRAAGPPLSAVAWSADTGLLAATAGGWVGAFQYTADRPEAMPQAQVHLLGAGEAYAVVSPKGQVFRNDRGELLWRQEGTDGVAALLPPRPEVPARLTLRRLADETGPAFGQPGALRVEVENAPQSGTAYWLHIDAPPSPSAALEGQPWTLLPTMTTMRLPPGASTSFVLNIALRRSKSRLSLPPRSLSVCLRIRHAHEGSPSGTCQQGGDAQTLLLEVPVGPWWWRHLEKLGLLLGLLLFSAWQLSWSAAARRLRRHPLIRAVRQGQDGIVAMPLATMEQAEQTLQQANATFALRGTRRQALRLADLTEVHWQRVLRALASPPGMAQALADCLHIEPGAAPTPLFQSKDLFTYELSLPPLSLHLPSLCTLLLCNPESPNAGSPNTKTAGSAESIEALLRTPREQLQRIQFALVIDRSLRSDLARFAQVRVALKSLCPGVPFVLLEEDALRRILFAKEVAAAQAALREPIVAQCEPSSIVSYQEGGGIPPDDRGLFFGRHAELDRMLSRLHQNFLLVGPRKMGKSSLLNALLRELARRHPDAKVLRYEPLFGRLQGIESRDAALRAETPELFYESVLQRSQAHQIFLLDETDDFIAEEGRTQYRYCKAMRALAGQGRASFVLAGYQELLEATQSGDHPLFNFGEVLRLEPLDREAAQRMIVEPISALGMRFEEPQQTVDWLRDQTACRPHVLALLCAALVKLRSPLSPRPISQSEVQGVCLQRDLLQTAFGSWSGEAVSLLDRVVLRATLLLDEPAPADVRAWLNHRGVTLSESELKASLNRLYARHYALLDDRAGRLRCPVPLFRFFVTESPSPSSGEKASPTGEASLRAQLAVDIQALTAKVTQKDSPPGA